MNHQFLQCIIQVNAMTSISLSMLFHKIGTSDSGKGETPSSIPGACGSIDIMESFLEVYSFTVMSYVLLHAQHIMYTQ